MARKSSAAGTEVIHTKKCRRSPELSYAQSTFWGVKFASYLRKFDHPIPQIKFILTAPSILEIPKDWGIPKANQHED